MPEIPAGVAPFLHSVMRVYSWEHIDMQVCSHMDASTAAPSAKAHVQMHSATLRARSLAEPGPLGGEGCAGPPPTVS